MGCNIWRTWGALYFSVGRKLVWPRECRRDQLYQAFPRLFQAFGIYSSAILPRSEAKGALLIFNLLHRSVHSFLHIHTHTTCHFKPLQTHFTLQLQVPQAQIGVMFSWQPIIMPQSVRMWLCVCVWLPITGTQIMFICICVCARKGERERKKRANHWQPIIRHSDSYLDTWVPRQCHGNSSCLLPGNCA